METPEFSWAFETKFQRGKQWYMIAVTLVLAFIVMSFLLGAYPLGILSILFVGVYLLYEINTPEITQVSVSTSGITINNEPYSYTRLSEFGIIRISEGPTILRIITNDKLIKSLDVFIDPTIDILGMTEFISLYIPENPQIGFSIIERVLLSLRL